MANHKSAKKRARQTVVRTAKNRTLKSRIHTAMTKALKAAGENDNAKSTTTLSKAQSELARAASKGVMPKQRAARKMSRLSAQAKKAKAK